VFLLEIHLLTLLKGEFFFVMLELNTEMCFVGEMQGLLMINLAVYMVTRRIFNANFVL
jgi:hypothetical protein